MGREILNPQYPYHANHHAYTNCYLDAICSQLHPKCFDPLSLLKTICNHARKNSEKYSAMVREGIDEFLSIIDEVEKSGEKGKVLRHIQALIQISEDALQKPIVVLDERGNMIYDANNNTSLSADTIVIVHLGNTFRGTAPKTSDGVNEESSASAGSL
ncbi:uncharacterized protein [Watersipora subatra]